MISKSERDRIVAAAMVAHNYLMASSILEPDNEHGLDVSAKAVGTFLAAVDAVTDYTMDDEEDVG